MLLIVNKGDDTKEMSFRGRTTIEEFSSNRKRDNSCSHGWLADEYKMRVDIYETY